MERILDLFPSLARSSEYAEVLQEFMQSCDEHQAFSTRETHAVQPFISHINNQLNDPAHRLKGLVLLNAFLPQCSDQQFNDHGISWMGQCVRGIESALCTETNETAYRVLKLLLEMASNFTEMNKNVNQSIIVKFSENLKRPGMNMGVQVAALDCVRVLISNYGAACGSQRSNIEQFIVQFADFKDAHTVSIAARCFSALPLVGSSGTSTFHKARWLEQQQKTCYSLRLLLDQLFENIKEGDVFVQGENSEKLPLELLTNMDPVLRVYEIADRFNNLTVFLGAMLTRAYPAAKSVLPDLILGTICRGLGVNCSTLGNKTTNELLALSSVLPRMHVSLLALLRSLILCLGKNLYPYGKVICKLVVQSLKWTSTAEKRYGVVRRYGNVRAAAYETLSHWLTVAKGGSGVGAHADALFDVLAVDVATERTTVKLTVQPRKKGTPKRKQPQASEADALAVTTPRNKLRDRAANERPCLAALGALHALLHAAAVQLKPTLHKALQELSLAVALDVQRSSRDDLPIPYASRACRAALYRLVTALTLNPHPVWPPPTQYALAVLARGQSDGCADVAGGCTVALAQVEKLVHPAARSLEFPVSLEDMLKAGEMEAKRASREMRQVLVATTDDLKSGKRSVTFDERADVKKFRLDDVCIDLSSDEDGAANADYVESNASVISSNSNYQDLVLKETEDDDKTVESTTTPKAAAAVVEDRDDDEEIEQIDLSEDENDVSFVSSTSAAAAASSPRRDRSGGDSGAGKTSPRKGAATVSGDARRSPPKASAAVGGDGCGSPITLDDDEEEGPPRKLPEIDGEGSGDKSKEVQSFKGLTDEEVLNLVAGGCGFLDDE